MTPQVLYMGGNGHGAARFAPAQQVLARLADAPFALVDVPYPGFEERPRAHSLDAFLEAVNGFVVERTRTGCAVVYGTGIGGLLALCLRARGQLYNVSIIMQGPVLWGLEKRLMPCVLRFPPAQWLLLPLFATRPFQQRFVGKYFAHPPSDAIYRRSLMAMPTALHLRPGSYRNAPAPGRARRNRDHPQRQSRRHFRRRPRTRHALILALLLDCAVFHNILPRAAQRLYNRKNAGYNVECRRAFAGIVSVLDGQPG